MQITDAQMFESLEYLRDEDMAISKARAKRITIEEGRKHLKARLINQSEAKIICSKRARCLCKPRVQGIACWLTNSNRTR